jgi:HSP20 family protein
MTNLIRRTRRPWPETTNPFGDFDNLMAGFFRPVADMPQLANGGFTPAVDIRETNEAYLVEAELPGLTKKDIDVTFENGVLTLSGERKLESETEQEGYRRIERRYGTFSRSFSLPREVDAEGVKATFAEGLLTITVPKVEQAKPRAIAIS